MLTLTIAIPTYNRNQVLARNVELLVPQLTDRCELLVIDNHSDRPVTEDLGSVQIRASGKVRIICNQSNVGGDANILRCIEHAQGDFVWVLGDDDEPSPDAVMQALQEIDEYPDVDVFRFFDPTTNEKAPLKGQRLTSVDAYLKNSNSLGTLIFMSTLVLRVREAKRYLHEANFFQSCAAPMLIVVLKMMDVGSTALSSPKILTPSTGHARTMETNSLESCRIAVALPMLLFVDWRPDVRNRLKVLMNGWWCLRIQIAALCGLLNRYSHGQVTEGELRSKISLIFTSSKLAENPFSMRKLIRWAFGLLVLFPTIGSKLTRVIYKSKGELKFGNTDA